MRYLFIRFFALLLLAFPMTAGRAAAPTRPLMFEVRAYGATGDGKTSDTAAINRAIAAAAAAGGGTVWFSAGTYASHSILLQSSITLHLDAGATLLAADPPPAGASGGYDPAEPNAWNQYTKTSATRTGTTASSGEKTWKTSPSPVSAALTDAA